MSRTISNSRSVAASRITLHAFIRRFTADERKALELAGAHDPAASSGAKADAAECRAISRLLFSGNELDVSESQNSVALSRLESLGVLTAGRGAFILAAVAEADRP